MRDSHLHYQRYDGSANLTGIAVTDNIRTNTNATFLQNVNVSGTTTATTFIGLNLTGDVSGTSGSPQVTLQLQKTCKRKNYWWCIL